jgi:hypothetical protein
MGAPQFTPGPWRAAISEVYPLNGERELEICRIPHNTYDAIEVFAPTTDGRETWDSRHTEPRHDEHLANARLIAAAPELYEALSEVVTLLEGWHRLNFADEIQQQSVRLAKRALAKARGEQEASK